MIGLGKICLAGCSLAALVHPAQAGDLLVRVRAVTVAPNDGGRNSGIQPDIATGTVDVEEAYVPEIDVSYFFTPNLAVETICCAARHAIRGDGAIAGLGKAASTWVTPFTLNLQYHVPMKGFKPYVGAGPMWAVFYGEKEKQSLKDALGDSVKLNVHNKVGFDLQAGVDVPIGERLVFNVDFKYYFVRPSADFTGGSLARTQSVDIKLDPIIAGFGIGYKF